MKPMPLECTRLYELLELIGRGCGETRHLLREQGAGDFTLDYAAEVVRIMAADLAVAIANARQEHENTFKKWPDAVKSRRLPDRRVRLATNLLTELTTTNQEKRH